MSYQPSYFQKLCEGWDMRRNLIVDFAGDDQNGAGESICVLTCGFDEDRPAAIRRLMRHKISTPNSHDLEQVLGSQFIPIGSSIFGNTQSDVTPSSVSTPRSRTSSHDSQINTAFRTEWRLSDFTLGELKGAQLSARATDNSQFAVITTSEDPLLGMSGCSNASSPLASPPGQMPQPSTASEIPGQRARFMAVGTTSGAILLWNMRAAPSRDVDIINSIAPMRMIYTAG